MHGGGLDGNAAQVVGVNKGKVNKVLIRCLINCGEMHRFSVDTPSCFFSLLKTGL